MQQRRGTGIGPHSRFESPIRIGTLSRKSPLPSHSTSLGARSWATRSLLGRVQGRGSNGLAANRTYAVILGFAAHVLAVLPLTFAGACSFVPSTTEPPVDDPSAGHPGAGTAQLSGVIQSAEGDPPLPLGGVRVTFGDAAAISNVDGSFTLAEVSAGSHELFFDGSALVSGDGSYGQFKTSFTLAEEETRILERPVYLPFVATRSQRTIAPDAVTVAESAEGVTLRIPPGAARKDGRTYEGVLSLVSIAASRTPMALPGRFAERVSTVVSIQPAGISFPVPLALTVPAGEGVEEATPRLHSLWGQSESVEGFSDTGIGELRDGGVVTIHGGVEASGLIFYSTWEPAVRSPCSRGGDLDDTAGCLQAARDLWNEVRTLNSGRISGARTLFGRLDTALGARQNSAERARTVLEVSRGLYAIAREATPKFQDFYRRLGALDRVELSLAEMTLACDGVRSCRGDDREFDQCQESLEARLAEAVENVLSFAPRFDRFSAGAARLAVFYDEPAALEGEGVGAFGRAAGEFNAAYRDFVPFASPIDAYDDLLDSLGQLEAAAREAVEAISVASGEGEETESGPLLIRVCPERGATSSYKVKSGRGPVVEFEGEGSADGCAIVALDREAGRSSDVILESTLLGTDRTPIPLVLTRTVTTRTARMGELHSGVITRESPVQEWIVEGENRAAVRVTFSSVGGSWAGMAGADGVTILARGGGFEAVNLDREGGLIFQALAADLLRDEVSTYEFEISASESLVDLGQPLLGSFDAGVRAAAAVFRAEAGDRIILQRLCCDPSGELFAQEVRGPEGAVLIREGGGSSSALVGGTAFEAVHSGVHRLLLTPFPGRFADYELVIHVAPTEQATPIALGLEVVGELDEVGERALYRFAAGANQRVTVEGLTAEGLESAQVTLTGPEGEIVGAGESLYFDGSTFSRRDYVVPSDGTYSLSFTASANRPEAVGGITFRVTAIGE